ncbi:PIN domain-containing protein [Antrihabitans cavernicola]|uniref:PIN domain-containing protein n=1 Tax=Antrihabitans cavernicola TaxID=2495913 RepID=A0A5A7S283_9NOCA|nr:PIN domain-containing protein [Spelaeibacter cavernicola]KAA0017037.1 PIN domain-containing protein [Spelaeibacter cavernicola]
MFAAVLDTCVLWPSLQRDLLLSLAVENLYRPLWSDAILDELEYHEARKLVDRGADPEQAAIDAARLLHVMREAFDDAIVEHWEPLEGTFGLPDVDDEHVVAAAVVGGAGAIVTDNLRDFPSERIPGSIHVVSAAEFVADTTAVDPNRARAAIEAISARLTRPPKEVDEILDILTGRYGMGAAVEMIRNA